MSEVNCNEGAVLSRDGTANPNPTHTKSTQPPPAGDWGEGGWGVFVALCDRKTAFSHANTASSYDETFGRIKSSRSYRENPLRETSN